jgi:quercetin dioxygenase-like cupin family protein
MIEQVFKLTETNDRLTERIIADENVHYMHMIFNKGEGLPEHISNAVLYMTVVKGTLSIGLNDQIINKYVAGTVLKIPKGIKMNVRNEDDELLEIINIKAPAPTK